MAINIRIAVCINLSFECVARTAQGETKRLAVEHPVYKSGKLLHRGARCALEAALTLRGVIPGASITAVAAGPPAAGWAMHHCLALGVDGAVHLSSEAAAAGNIINPLQVSLIFSQYLEGQDLDLVFCGHADAKYDNTPLGPLLAEHMGLPFISEVVAIDEVSAEHGLITATRFLSRGNRIKIRTSLPAILGVHPYFKEPRYMSLRSLKRIDARRVQSIPVNNSTTRGNRSNESIIIEPLRVRPKMVAAPPVGASYRERLDFIITGGGPEEKKVNLLEGDVNYIAGEIIDYLEIKGTP